ncbi:hypothetical protein LJR066_006681 [Acidovorax sp. LjRoot66]|uniref:hypothetical protein n=1 Tax=Acidovorax sp. LjRoot66 TaxID=3342334 RepID=UPI003ED0475B
MGALQIIACLLILAVIVGLIVLLNVEETKDQTAASDGVEDDDVAGTYKPIPGPDQLDAGDGQLIDWGPNTKHF